MRIERRRAIFAELLSDTPIGASHLGIPTGVRRTQRLESNPHNVDLGYAYGDGAALVPGDTDAPPRDPLGIECTPSRRPSHRLPHAWFETSTDHWISTHDVVTTTGFGRIASGMAGAWRAVAPGDPKAAFREVMRTIFGSVTARELAEEASR